MLSYIKTDVLGLNLRVKMCVNFYEVDGTVRKQFMEKTVSWSSQDIRKDNDIIFGYSCCLPKNARYLEYS